MLKNILQNILQSSYNRACLSERYVSTSDRSESLLVIVGEVYIELLL